MAAPMRAKMVVSTVESHEGGVEVLRLRAVARSDSYPADGRDENNTYAKFSPSASLELHVNNPALFGRIKAGEHYYVDFTPVPLASSEAKS